MTDTIADNAGVLTAEPIRESDLLGTWHLASVDETFEKPFHAEVLQVFMPGGSLIAISPGAPSTTVGGWRLDEGGALSTKWFEFDFDQNVKFAYRLEGSVSATVKDGTIRGTFSYDQTDPEGKFMFTGHGTIEGTRLSV
jgi:hypothetical protein